MCLTEDTPSALSLEREISFLLKGNDLECYFFPDWETLPYDHFSPHQDIISQRLETLYRLPHLKKGVVIMPIATGMQRLTPVDYLLQHSLLVKKVSVFPWKYFRENLYKPVIHPSPKSWNTASLPRAGLF